jgi:hypothetical protein
VARRRKQTVDACAVLDSIGARQVADAVGYRKPKNANGSRGRYFFARLQRQCR